MFFKSPFQICCLANIKFLGARIIQNIYSIHRNRHVPYLLYLRQLAESYPGLLKSVPSGTHSYTNLPIASWQALGLVQEIGPALGLTILPDARVIGMRRD